ncbi:hypothetical protein ABPG77_000526 [Micractinium sp. CCAP 211/92]
MPPTVRVFLALCLCIACACTASAAEQGQAGSAPKLPTDPAAICNRDTMFEVTSKEFSCSESLYRRDPAVESCCVILESYYGPNSTLPSRNCFCVESYWAELQELSERHYIRWKSYLSQCTDMGYPIYYFQDGEGPCAGPPPPAPPAAPAAAVPSTEVAAEPLPMRTFGGWVAGLGNDAWGAVSFTAGILSVLGTSVMAWMFVYDAWCDVSVCCGKKHDK